jgi:WD40 repeat protein
VLDPLRFANSVSLSPGGDFLAAAIGGAIKLWSTTPIGRLPRRCAVLESSGPDGGAVTFSRDGALLAASGPRETVALWEMARRRRLASLDAHAKYQALRLSPDSRTLAVLDQSTGSAELWDTRSARRLTRLRWPASGMSSIAFSPDGRLLYLGSWGDGVKIWDLEKSAERPGLAAATNLASLAAAPDGQTLATGHDDGTIRITNLRVRREVAILRGHTASIHALAFSASGDVLASGSGDGTVRLWRAPTLKETGGAPGTAASGPALSASEDNSR